MQPEASGPPRPTAPRLSRMCGIVGYVGPRQAQDVVVDGLRRLEYRGYDSAGVALVADGALVHAKRAGKLANLEKALADEPLPEATTGIGHTRWATHGAPNDVNAHPHLGAEGRVALVHNGIIENFARLRTELEDAGHELRSETDTEVAAHLLERAVADGADLTVAMQHVCTRLEGAFTLVAVDSQDPDRVVAARRSSPLVVGIGEGENFLGSDVAAFIEHTREALELGLERREVLDDPVVDDRDVAVAPEVRVGVVVGRAAVRRPAGVADAGDRRRQRLGVQGLGEPGELPGTLGRHQTGVGEQGHPGRVVAAVLQPA